MANWTDDDVVNGALEHLGIKPSNQSADAESFLTGTNCYASVYPQLRKMGLAPWASDSVEEEAQQPLAKYLAAQLAVKFGFTGERLMAIKFDGDLGLRELTEQAAGDRQVVPIRNNYF